MTKTSTGADVGALAEFLDKAPAPSQRVVVNISKDNHRELTDIAQKLAGETKRFVPLGLVVDVLLQHYKAFE